MVPTLDPMDPIAAIDSETPSPSDRAADAARRAAPPADAAVAQQARPAHLGAPPADPGHHPGDDVPASATTSEQESLRGVLLANDQEARQLRDTVLGPDTAPRLPASTAAPGPAPERAAPGPAAPSGVNVDSERPQNDPTMEFAVHDAARDGDPIAQAVERAEHDTIENKRLLTQAAEARLALHASRAEDAEQDMALAASQQQSGERAAADRAADDAGHQEAAKRASAERVATERSAVERGLQASEVERQTATTQVDEGARRRAAEAHAQGREQQPQRPQAAAPGDRAQQLAGAQAVTPRAGGQTQSAAAATDADESAERITAPAASRVGAIASGGLGDPGGGASPEGRDAAGR